MSALTDQILELFQKERYSQAFTLCLEYVDECQNAFMEALTVNTATDFAGSVILLSQICAEEKKPWKAVPKLDLASGCIRFLEDYMQDREMLASVCNSFGFAYEYAGFLPESLKYYTKSLEHGNSEVFLKDVVYSVFLLSLRVNNKIEESVLSSVKEKLRNEAVDELRKSAQESFSKMLLTDPIEKTEAFLSVRYEVEKTVDEMLSDFSDTSDSRPFCIRYWECKKSVLFEKFGISWRTPAECNPNVCFQ